MKISTKFDGPSSASYQVICKGVRKTPQKRKKHEIPCQSDIPARAYAYKYYKLANLQTLPSLTLVNTLLGHLQTRGEP